MNVNHDFQPVWTHFLVCVGNAHSWFMYLLCFQISIPSGREVHILDCLLSASGQDVRMAGLGARDSLRLEAGLCLYGNDINEETTPVEAALTWLIGMFVK